MGGSHVAGALLDMQRKKLFTETYQNVPLDSKASPDDILNTWCFLIKSILSQINESELQGISIAVPGPFNYERGICMIEGLDKYDGCFGIDVAHSIINRLSLLQKQLTVTFYNDAQCFVVGEAVFGVAKSYSKVIGLTLGTGFGAAFYSCNCLITDGQQVPKNGELYNVPFEGGMAEDYISARWFLQSYEQKTGKRLDGVKELYERAENDVIARNLFIEFGKNLGKVLAPFILSFDAECIVLGGNISKAAKYFLPSLQQQIEDQNCNIKILFSSLAEKAAIMGSAQLAYEKIQGKTDNGVKILRKTNQFLVPLERPVNTIKGYDIFPAFPLSGAFMQTGYATLAEAIKDKKTVIIEGYSGVFWDEMVSCLNAVLTRQNKKVTWLCSDAGLKSEEEINKMLEPYLGGDDPLFGIIYPGELIDFFDINRLSAFSIDHDADINIIYGCGSSLVAKEGFLIYADVPKNEIQFRSRASAITNLGATGFYSPKQMYKRFYYVDWIVLNKHKKSLLPDIDIIADTQRPKHPVFTDGHSLRETLKAMSKSVVRARPWFEPGVWGGQWIKENISELNHDEINYAWSFELITPENGLLIEYKKLLLEVSFDFLMYSDNKAVSGDAAKRFGDEFPIRFDFLDTFSGGNLSLQCHPSTAYIKQNFGENYTQDETYYILKCGKDASVYLGFQDNVDEHAFKIELEKSFETNKEVNVEKFVQKHPAHKHDLFLIPNGTIHCSGINNLVLEISSTPYIYTFKMYDWLRNDLEGNPRPLNIDRAFDNLCFERKGKKVKEELISKPYKYSGGKGWECYHLPTHKEHFYDIYRYHIHPFSVVEIDTANECHIMSLVEGERVTVQTVSSYSAEFHYAETFFVPAAAEKYTLKNTTADVIQVVVAFVNPKKYQ
nr:ROK family protein [Segetibacter koreensis]